MKFAWHFTKHCVYVNFVIENCLCEQSYVLALFCAGNVLIMPPFDKRVFLGVIFFFFSKENF